jgi:hypothetical protein
MRTAIPWFRGDLPYPTVAQMIEAGRAWDLGSARSSRKATSSAFGRTRRGKV